MFYSLAFESRQLGISQRVDFSVYILAFLYAEVHEVNKKKEAFRMKSLLNSYCFSRFLTHFKHVLC